MFVRSTQLLPSSPTWSCPSACPTQRRRPWQRPRRTYRASSAIGECELGLFRLESVYAYFRALNDLVSKAYNFSGLNVAIIHICSDFKYPGHYNASKNSPSWRGSPEYVRIFLHNNSYTNVHIYCLRVWSFRTDKRTIAGAFSVLRQQK